MIKKYEVQCLYCGEVLVLTRERDVLTCSCPNQTYVKMSPTKMIYGGNDMVYVKYLREYKL